MLLSLVYFYLQIFFVGFAIPLLLVFRRYPIARKIFVKIFLNNIFCLDLYKVVLLLRYTFDFVVSSFLPFCVLLVWNFAAMDEIWDLINDDVSVLCFCFFHILELLFSCFCNKTFYVFSKLFSKHKHSSDIHRYILYVCTHICI